MKDHVSITFKLGKAKVTISEIGSSDLFYRLNNFFEKLERIKEIEPEDWERTRKYLKIKR